MKNHFSLTNSSSTLQVLALSFLASCATARVVTLQPGKGGTIAVQPPQDPDARQKATLMMADNCGAQRYEILEEGEAVIGSTTNANGNASVLGSSLLSNANSSTKQETEWRIKYKCK